MSHRSYISTLAAKPYQTRYEWRWQAWQTKIKLAAMQYESDRFAWQGSQLAYIGFDELTHFTQEQFFTAIGQRETLAAYSSAIGSR